MKRKRNLVRTLRRLRLHLVILLSYAAMIVVTWAILSFICFVGMPLLLIVDPGMTVSEMIHGAVWAGAAATGVFLATAYLSERGGSA
jgi:uncharacterized membrane protein YcgQ (UPF0703/DUF1980 family)